MTKKKPPIPVRWTSMGSRRDGFHGTIWFDDRSYIQIEARSFDQLSQAMKMRLQNYDKQEIL